MNPVVCIAFSFLGCFNFINAASIPSKAALTLPYGRSVEGAEVDISEYPYQVTLLYFSSQICAGSIISPRWILTAAHCLSSGNVLFRYTIRAGSNFRNSGGVSVAVVSIRPHSRYNSSSEEYDIGLVRITSDLTYDNTIRAVSLPTPNIDIRSGTNATATGWEDGVSQSHLRSVSIPLVDNDVCQQSYGNRIIITENMICAGFSAGGNICQGNSGEPLVTSQYGQVGVASWGNECGRAGPYGVYTRVSAFRTWINSISRV